MSTRKLFLSHALSLLAASLAPGISAAQPSGGFGPVSPAFQYFEQNRLSHPDTGVHAKGHIPSPLDLRHLAPSRPRLLGATPTARFDLRELNRLSAVRDQSSCGACWAFATMASLESSLKPSETWDFSENNLKNNHGFRYNSCGGGTADMAIAYFTRWNGPVRESDDLYVPASTSSPTLPPVRLVEDALLLGSRTDSTSVDAAIKQVLLDYNVAIYTAMQMDEGYDSTNHSYLYRGTAPRHAANHAVAIVGWDDDFAAGNFFPPAQHDGAWIVRNSWGPGWGDGGYFYVSYEDPNFGQECTVFLTPALVSKYDIIHDYSPLGATANYGFGDATAWEANIFSTQGSEIVIAASFFALAANTSYEIYVYENVTAGQPQSGTLAAGPISGTFTYGGYHTVPLGAGVSLASAQKFSVVIKLTSPGETNPIALESPMSWAPATAHAGESFVSSNGSVWYDATRFGSGSNVALKALSISTCDDDNPCTRDAFDSARGCTFTPNLGALCDDGLSCTDNDVCDVRAVCRGSLVPDECLIDGTCADAFSPNPTNPCERCDPSTPTAWSTLADGTSCEDLRFCNGHETCHAGVCTSDAAPTCDDGVPCTSDYCDATLDACEHLLQTGFCLIGAECFGDGIRNPANSCQACDAFGNGALWATLPDQAACDDQDLCTQVSVCESGVCTGKAPKPCARSTDGCLGDGQCNPATGECVWPAAADGTACDDGQPCTEGDHCERGRCTGLEVLCAAEECSVGRCDAQAGGCVQEKASDGSACTGGTCRAGVCRRDDALRSYACGTSGGPASVLVMALVALALAPRRVRL